MLSKYSIFSHTKEIYFSKKIYQKHLGWISNKHHQHPSEVSFSITKSSLSKLISKVFSWSSKVSKISSVSISNPPKMAVELESSTTQSEMITQPKLQGRDLYNAIGKPKKIVAPMVDQSELAWRILSRRYGADLCYTPMFHARLFATQEKYRNDMWSELDGELEKDRPLIVQFCANDPEYLLQAAKSVQHKCDAVDLNLGCPQGIAKKGHYGAFLMDDWDLIYKLINKLHNELDIPVTAKIRIYDDLEKSLAYAKMVLSAGAQFITIHGRTREMKGQKTGLANWKTLKYIKDNLPEGTVFFGNGNVLYPSDLQRFEDEVKCDAVMSAEGNLYNPGVFWTKSDDKEKQFPRVDRILREYFEIVKSCPGNASKNAMKSHFFKVLRPFVAVHTNVRDMIAKSSPKHDFGKWELIVNEVERIVEELYKSPNISELDAITEGDLELWGGRYKTIPYWRCQPYFRPVNGIPGNERALEALKAQNNNHPSKEAGFDPLAKLDTLDKRKAEDELDDHCIKKVSS